ncbi:serine hydroxymethyltransferase [Candidatus Calescamantes bacterium]|nr:serine hydroxymethyltransferase [Candidatus Calescamantes bacterium]
MKDLKSVDPEIYNSIKSEEEREVNTLILIASENYTSPAVREAQGSVLTHKYAEGYPGKRYYGGCSYVDMVEKLAVERAKKLFSAPHVNVQPHSGTQANMAVYLSTMNPGDALLGMDISSGGHLTHGHRVNFSGKMFRSYFYGVKREGETIDFNEVEEKAKKYRPRIIVCGASAYSRIIDFKTFREIADRVGAYLLADIAHIAGEVAAGLHPSPFPYAHFVTATTHKTLRGPRGGLIMCQKEFSEAIDTMVFPGIQGGPLMHVIAAKAVCLKEASSEEFREYQRQILKNSRTLAKLLQEKGYRIVSGGTDNHLFLLDLRSKGITGKEAEIALEKAGISVNKNTIPFDPLPPTIASGIRIGTPAVTSRGMREKEMELIAELIDEVLVNTGKEEVLWNVRKKVEDLCKSFPIEF